MNDFLFVAVIVGFFAPAALFVRAWGRIVGVDVELSITCPPVAKAGEQVAA